LGVPAPPQAAATSGCPLYLSKPQRFLGLQGHLENRSETFEVLKGCRFHPSREPVFASHWLFGTLRSILSKCLRRWIEIIETEPSSHNPNGIGCKLQNHPHPPQRKRWRRHHAILVLMKKMLITSQSPKGFNGLKSCLFAYICA